MAKGICLLVVTLLLPGPGLAVAQSNDAGTGIIVEQNLFHPGRSVPPPPPKPAPPKAVARPAPPPPPPPKFEVAGIVKDGRSAMALLQEPQLTQGKPRIVSLGESLGGYTLVGIEDDRVRLESESGTMTVLLHAPKSARSVATVVPPARPAGAPSRALPTDRLRPSRPERSESEQADPDQEPPQPVQAQSQGEEKSPEARALENAFKAFGLGSEGGTRRPPRNRAPSR